MVNRLALVVEATAIVHPYLVLILFLEVRPLLVGGPCLELLRQKRLEMRHRVVAGHIDPDQGSCT